MLTRWEPFAARGEMNRVHDQLDRLFGRWANGARELSATTYPPLNLWEDGENYFVEAELPGFKLEDLEIYMTGENQISIKGERHQPESGNGKWHRQERGYGTFTRLMEIPGPVAGDDVTASIKDGVLLISLPKREDAKPKRIEVKAS